MLSSKPGSEKVLYLDFNGHSEDSTNAWGEFDAYAFSLDNDFTNFNINEKLEIEGIWRRVTEDYAPWQYDVTTVRLTCSSVPSNDLFYLSKCLTDRARDFWSFHDAGSGDFRCAKEWQLYAWQRRG